MRPDPHRFRSLARGPLAAVLMGATALVAPQAFGQESGMDDNMPDEIDMDQCPWMDTSLSADERANLLLDNSSLGQTMRWLNEWAANRPTENTFEDVTYEAQVPCTPDVLYANGPEGLHGTEGATAWPAPIALAASFNTDIAEERGAALAVESFEHGVSVLLGPGIASGRNPISGRTPEYFGEAALLSGLMGAATVRGMEDVSAEMAVISNLKHYVGNEQELDRELSSSNIDERTLQQVYDLPYLIAIEQSDPGSLMCSFNQLNNVYLCENDILDANINERAGFRGYVMSDFGAVHSTAPSLLNGLDQELNRPVYFTPELLNEALEAGEIAESDIRDAAFRVVRSYIEHGLFDNPRPEEEPEGPVSSPEHRDLALELAEQGMVLLKNDGALPLSSEDAGTIALIGPTASIIGEGNVDSTSSCAAFLTFTQGPVLNCDAMIDPLTAFAQRAGESGGNVIYADGSDMDAVTRAAEMADTVFVFGFLSMGEFSDPEDLILDGDGTALIEAASSANPNTVVISATGSAVEMPWIDEVAGVVQTWYAGDMTGPALANLVFGDSNFSGRLPMTFPVSMDSSPIQTQAQYPGVFQDNSTDRVEDDEETIRQVEYSEGLEVGFQWYQENDVAPLFAFGHGLSYSDFAYSDLSVSSEMGESGLESQVTFTVENTSDVDGTAVPQLYLGFPDSAEEPGMRLVGFDRVDLGAGESQEVTMTLSTDAGARPYQIWDVDADAWTMVEGDYTLALGQSAQDMVLEQTHSVSR